MVLGNSQAAFNRDQLATIALLIHENLGSSYAARDQCLQFPLIAVELKSQAKNGILYAAISQFVGAGAIALHGHLELWSRTFGFVQPRPQRISILLDDYGP